MPRRNAGSQSVVWIVRLGGTGRALQAATGGVRDDSFFGRRDASVEGSTYDYVHKEPARRAVVDAQAVEEATEALNRMQGMKESLNKKVRSADFLAQATNPAFCGWFVLEEVILMPVVEQNRPRWRMAVHS